MQTRGTGPQTGKSGEKSALGSALLLEALAGDARNMPPEAFAQKHGNAFLLFTAKRMDGPESTNSTKLLLDGDSDEAAGRTANLAVVVFPLRPKDAAKGSMITLGREARQDVVIPDMSVSRFHAFAKPGPDGALLWTMPLGTAKFPGIGVEDIGRCAYGVFKRGTELTGQYVGIAGEHLTGEEMAAAIGQALGQPVRYNAVTPAQFRGFGFPGAEDLGNMFQFNTEFAGDFCRTRDLNASRALNPALQTFRQWLDANKANLPLA